MYRFKRAESEWELEQVFRLNHETFARELGQYVPHADGLLIDKFHDKNVYYIAMEGEAVVGMIAVHDQPPFSVTEKLRDARALEELGRILEVRLLAVEPAHRNQMVLGGLFWSVLDHGRTGGHHTLVISGLTHQHRMYQKLGFEALGPPARSGEAWFAPMALRLEKLPEHVRVGAERWVRRRKR